jgi:hypothetical protein
MPRYYKPEANKTYATEANALKAVYKLYPADRDDGLQFIIFKTEEGRYFPIFTGERALQAMVHFHFNVVG